jgi:hypothetical protein
MGAGDLSSVQGRWTFEDVGKGRTKATYAHKIDISRGPKRVRRAMIASILMGEWINGLKKRAETA